MAERMSRRSTQVAGWTLAAAATYAAVFVLPYRFPPSEPVWSATWIAGTDNRAAAAGLALVSLAVTLACRLRGGRIPETGTPQPLDRRFLYGGMAIAVLWTLGLGWAVARAHVYWGDEGYFLNQLRAGLVFHRALYREVEFAYGPALYWWPALFVRMLAPLGVSMTAAYLAALAVLQCLGLMLLSYTVDALPMRRSLKACAFLLIAFGTLNSLLGVNYSVFRFVLPLAAAVFLARRRTWLAAAAVAGVGEMATMAVSPELGVAFGGAVVAVAALRRGRWMWSLAGAAAGAGLFARLAGPASFFTLRNMAKGGFNLLLTPAPHLLALLLAVAVLAPLAVARTLRQDQPGPLLPALYLAALGMLPAALGRCDPIHCFFGGIGFYLLAFVALDAAPAGWRRTSILALALVFAFAQAKNVWVYQYRLGVLLHRRPIQEDDGFDEAKLLKTLGGARISLPVLAPERVVEDLTRSGQYVPSYFCGMAGVWDRETERRKIAEMRRTEFTLVALSDAALPNPAEDREIARRMRMGLANHPPRPAYVRGALIDEELKEHWLPLGTYRDYQLFRQQH
jgi:hypothetical protein